MLSETGYAEGEMCHQLVTNTLSLTDKQAISQQGLILVPKFFLTLAYYLICLFFHGVVSLNLYFDAKVDFCALF